RQNGEEAAARTHRSGDRRGFERLRVGFAVSGTEYAGAEESERLGSRPEPSRMQTAQGPVCFLRGRGDVATVFYRQTAGRAQAESENQWIRYQGFWHWQRIQPARSGDDRALVFAVRGVRLARGTRAAEEGGR